MKAVVHGPGEGDVLPMRSFVCAPPGVRHTFANPSEAPVRFVNFNTLAAAARAEGGLTPEVVGRIAANYDIETAPDA